MPPGKEDWSKGKIYKIISNNPDVKEVYYGSTCQRLLCMRMATHRCCYKRWLDGKCGQCASYDLFKKYGVEQFHIELVENYPCENAEQLHTQENIYIRGNECVNKYSAITTREERAIRKHQQYIDNIEEKKAYGKQHREKNKEKIVAKRQENKEEMKIYMKQYCIDNKEALSTKKKEQITCECGCIIVRGAISRHQKSDKHKKRMELLI